MPTRDPAILAIQYYFVQMVTEHLCDCSKTFNGDLSEMLVLAVLGQVQLNEVKEHGLPEDIDLLASAGISASRIADVTGLPRQTVRRKLQSMEQKLWIFQGSDHRWRLCIKEGRVAAEEALEGLFGRGIERAMRLATAIKPFMRHSDES